MSNEKLEVGLTSHLTQELEALRGENKRLQDRVDRLELPSHYVPKLRKALANFGFGACESDEELMWMWPSYVKDIIRMAAEVKQISI